VMDFSSMDTVAIIEESSCFRLSISLYTPNYADSESDN